MKRYLTYRQRQRRRRKQKVSILVLAILVFVGVKSYTLKHGPFFSYARDRDFKVSVSSLTEEIASLSTDKLVANATAEVVGVEFDEKEDLALDIEGDLSEMLGEVKACINSNPPKVIEARDMLGSMLKMSMNAEQTILVKEQISALSEKWLFNNIVFEGDKYCSRYEVKSGDLLSVISKKFKVPYGVLMRINNISDARSLRAGRGIKVIKGPFNCKISRSQFTMDLYLQDTFVQSFAVGLGRSGMETPTGTWRVRWDGKMLSPTWTDPDSGRVYHSSDVDYPLGTRWIGLEGIGGAAEGRSGFALHGTKDPQEIGTSTSRGCIRLDNDDIEMVYDLLMPGVSQVEVSE